MILLLNASQTFSKIYITSLICSSVKLSDKFSLVIRKSIQFYLFFCAQVSIKKNYLPFAHLVLTAFRAISLRLSGESLRARAFPPFLPPSEPSNFAALFRSVCLFMGFILLEPSRYVNFYLFGGKLRWGLYTVPMDDDKKDKKDMPRLIIESPGFRISLFPRFTTSQDTFSATQYTEVTL